MTHYLTRSVSQPFCLKRNVVQFTGNCSKEPTLSNFYAFLKTVISHPRYVHQQLKVKDTAAVNRLLSSIPFTVCAIEGREASVNCFHKSKKLENEHNAARTLKMIYGPRVLEFQLSWVGLRTHAVEILALNGAPKAITVKCIGFCFSKRETLGHPGCCTQIWGRILMGLLYVGRRAFPNWVEGHLLGTWCVRFVLERESFL